MDVRPKHEGPNPTIEETLMSITQRITQARHDRDARRMVRLQHEKLVRELSAFSTPAERMEIEMIASRTSHPDAVVVLDILDQLSYQGTATRR